MYLFFKKLTSMIILLIGVIIIFCAISFSIIKYFVVEDDRFQDAIRNTLMEYYPGQINFGSIELNWSIYGPVFIVDEPEFDVPIKGVQLLNLSSLIIIPDYFGVISGDILAIQEVRINSADGVISMADWTANEAAQINSVSTNQALVVPNNLNLIINNLSLSIHDYADDIELTETSLYVSLSSDDLTVSLSGVALGMVNAFNIVINAKPNNLSDMELFAELRNANLSNLLIGLDYPLPQAIQNIYIDSSLWATFSAGRLVNGNAEIMVPNGIYFASPIEQYDDISYSEFGFNVEFEVTPENNTTYDINNLIINSDLSQWPTDAYLTFRKPNLENYSSMEIQGNSLILNDLIVLMSQVDQMDELIIKALGSNKVDGLLNNGLVEFQGFELGLLRAELQEISIGLLSKNIHVTNLAGVVEIKSNSINVELSSADVSIFIEDQQSFYSELTGTIDWMREADVESLVIEELNFLSPSEHLEVDLKYEQSVSGINSIEIELALNNFVLNKLNPLVSSYEPIVSYISNINGFISNANFLLLLSQTAQGISIDRSLAAAQIDDLAFDIEILGESFIGRDIRLVMDDRAATLDGFGGIFSDVDTFEINFENTFEQTLNMHFDSFAAAPQAHKVFIRMAEILPMVRDEVPSYALTQGEAHIETDLDLSMRAINLNDYNITTTLDDISLVMNNSNIELDNLNGVIYLNSQGILSNSLLAQLYGNEITIDAISIDEFPFDTEWRMSGNMLTNQVIESIVPDWSPFIEANSYAELTIKRPSLLRTLENDSPIMALEMVSKLIDLGVDLPQPFFKDRESEDLLSLRGDFFTNNEVFFFGSVNNDMDFSLEYRELRDRSLVFVRGVLSFGGVPLVEPISEGLIVLGKLPTIDFGEWIDFVDNQPSGLPLNAITLDIANASIFNYSIGDVYLDWHNLNDMAEIQITGNNVVGSIFLETSNPIIGLSADFQYIKWNHDTLNIFQGTNQSAINLDLSVDNAYWMDRHLGNVSLEALIEPQVISINSIQLVGDSFEFNGIATQLNDSEVINSFIDFNLTSADVSETMEELGINFVIEGDALNFDATLDWNDELSGWQTSSLAGELNFSISDGSIPNIDPGAGRITGLMSFAALPRRLAFDFRDVFSPGFVYDSIEASYTIAQGIAYTDNFSISGPIADIFITGDIDVANQQYRQLALVSDNAGDVLPSIGFLAGPGVGAALLVFSQIFKQPIQGISRAAYCITGTWDEPLINLLGNDLQNSACADL